MVTFSEWNLCNLYSLLQFSYSVNLISYLFKLHIIFPSFYRNNVPDNLIANMSQQQLPQIGVNYAAEQLNNLTLKVRV